MHRFSESHLWLWYMQKLICCCVSYFESSDLLQAIPSHSARRSLFEHYVKTRAEEKRKEKRAAQKAAVEGFKQLLEEASEVSWIAFNLIAFFSNSLQLWNYGDCKLFISKILIFRTLITTLIIKLSERNGAMIQGSKPWTAKIESIY